ncbi:MAG: PstS family phosphate ABC transporter substrate-binding protein [Candidatus Caldatribacteriaceae bacterium]
MKRFGFGILVLVFILGVAAPIFAQKIIQIDGSSTVYLITEAVAEEFQKAYPDIRVVVGISGTGGGFKKFTRGETDISNASRPIKSSEVEAAQANNIEYIELPVAFDALAVVVNKENTWATSMTVEELKKLWEPDSKVTMWSDLRPEWPKEKITLFGPGVDSGTFEYFTEAVVGEAGKSRGDYVASEDDNVLVQGVSQDRYALGYFGVAYYVENQDILNAVAIDNGNGPVLPLPENVINHTYRPLARPLFIYVNKKSAEREDVDLFVNFYLQHAAELAEEVGYVPLPEEAYELVKKRFAERKTGSIFGGEGSTPGVSIEEILKREEE